jgi:hypothetical protein
MARFIALAFQNNEGFEKCLRILYNEKRDIQFHLPGRRNIIIPVDELEYFRSLQGKGELDFEEVKVISIAEVSPEKAAELRKKHFMGSGPLKGG